MRQVLFLSVLILAAAVPGRSSYLVLYSFNGTGDVPATSSAAGVTGGDLTQNGLTAVTGNSLLFSATNWPGAFSLCCYFDVTITPDPGVSIDYSYINLDYTISAVPGAGTWIYSSVDGFASTILVAAETSTAGPTSYSNSLENLGVQSGPVEFRWYVFGVSSSDQAGLSGGSMDFRITPEPAPGHLLAAAALWIAYLRRRRQRPNLNLVR
jgi:hypothetical protein